MIGQNNKDALAELAGYIDQTLLRPTASDGELEEFCRQSALYHFKMVAIHSSPVAKCKRFLADSGVLVGAAIGFPLGQTTIPVKRYETEQAISDGADEIDYVIHLGELKNGNTAYLQKEMETIVTICRDHQVTSKVIFENCYLTREEKQLMCRIARQVGPDFVKTSTGFGPGGATQEDVRLMKTLVGDGIRVKAAGGIRTLQDMQDMLAAGAQRVGTSAGVAILEEWKKINSEKF